MTNFFDRLMATVNKHGVRDVPELAKKLGYSRPEKLYRLQRDKTNNPSVDILIDLTNNFAEIDLNYLLTGVETLNQTQSLVNLVKEPGINYSSLPKVISTDSQGHENILMVPHYAQAGYLDGFGDPEYLETLPSYRLPKIDHGTFRMFEVKGHSMNPTLHDGSIAVGEWCESLNSIVDDAIYIVVTKDDGIVIKRVLNRVNKYNNLYLKSDNRAEYPAYTITPDQVVEIWKLKTAFLFNFSNPANMFDRLTDLEAEMMHLKQAINK